MAATRKRIATRRKATAKAKGAKARPKAAPKKRARSAKARSTSIAVPAKVKKAALKVLTEAAVGAARAMIPPLQEVVAASEGRTKRASKRGKAAAVED